MNEVKSPKKPMLYYYAIALLVLLLHQLARRAVAEPAAGQGGRLRHVHDHDGEQEIGRVEVQDNQILFTNKDDTAGLQDRPDGRS